MKTYIQGFSEGAKVTENKAIEVAHEYAIDDFDNLTYNQGLKDGEFYHRVNTKKEANHEQNP